MVCKPEFDYFVLVVNEYIKSLPAPAAIAVAEKAQICAEKLEAVLKTWSAPATPEFDS